MTLRFIEPNWPAPPGVHAASTLRGGGGVSAAPYQSLNLGLHVGDATENVTENRDRLADRLQLPATPGWLTQVHGSAAINATTGMPEADAGFTRERGVVCAVMTADCLPVLLCTADGGGVAAVHAGWKGLANGILEASINALGSSNLLAWLGPAIGPAAFEVGEEVRKTFITKNEAYACAFRQKAQGKYLADIYQLGRITLMRSGVNTNNMYGGGWCTYSQPSDFFSYRRDRITGRMATLIWRE